MVMMVSHAATHAHASSHATTAAFKILQCYPLEDFIVTCTIIFAVTLMVCLMFLTSLFGPKAGSWVSLFLAAWVASVYCFPAVRMYFP